jgi:predicted metallopeptidase
MNRLMKRAREEAQGFRLAENSTQIIALNYTNCSEIVVVETTNSKSIALYQLKNILRTSTAERTDENIPGAKPDHNH